MKVAMLIVTPDILVFTTLIVTLIVVALSYRGLMRKSQDAYPLSGLIGKSSWEFGKSWAANITVFATFLCSILANVVGANKLIYAGLSLFFGMLTAFAPLAFNVTGRAQIKHTQTGEEETQLLNPLWAFLLSSIITLWAASGQVVTVNLLLGSLVNQGTFSPLVGITFQIFIVIALLLLWIYGFKTIQWTIENQMSPIKRQQRQKALYLAIGQNMSGTPSSLSVDDLKPEQPFVSLL